MLLGSNAEISKNLYKIVDSSLPLTRVWLGPVPMVILANPYSVKEVLTNRNALAKPHMMRFFGIPFLGDSLILSKGDTFDIFHYITKTGADSICASTLGVNINAHKAEQADYFNATQHCIHLLSSRALHPWKYPEVLYRFSDDYKQSLKHRYHIWELPTRIINQKKYNLNKNNFNNNNNNHDNNDNNNSLVYEKNTDRKPLLDYLIELTENNSKFTDKDLRDETNLLILAGYETTANAISYCLLNIAKRSEIKKKVYDELFSIFGESDRQIELDDLPKLEYMEMVIKESLRLYPTGPIIFREITNDIQIDKFIIPKGCSVAVPIFCIHRDPKFWENPLHFNPERFTPENISKIQPCTYIPFSFGPRNCIGGRYAMMFMKTVMSTLLRNYEFETDLDFKKLKFEFEISLKLVGGHQVRISPRTKNIKNISAL